VDHLAGSARFVNEATLKESNINVDTNAHIVTLTGTVVTPAGRARAGLVARETEGVRRVVNNLTGVAGMFLAVPVVGILSVVYRPLAEWRGGDATHRAAAVLLTSRLTSES
jgi:BON domain-containing protein